MILTILSKEKTIFDDTIESVLVMSHAGPFEIKQNHAPLIGMVYDHVIIKKNSGQETISIGLSILEVSDNCVSILLASDDL